MKFPDIISVKALEKYRILLSYKDGTEGVLDLAGLANKGVFEYWEEDDNFFKVHIDEVGGIAWNPSLDICPNAAYLTIKRLTFEEWKSLNQVHASSI